MIRSKKLVLSLILFIVLSGCANKYYPNIEARYLPDNTILNLNVTHPVAIKNMSTGKDETRLCRHTGHEFFGKPYDVTEAAIDIVKNAFQRKNINIDDNSDKTLALSVDNFTCESGWRLTATTTLKVRTGYGLEKEYTGSVKYENIFMTTLSFEEALGMSVMQMLTDKDIVEYLEQ